MNLWFICYHKWIFFFQSTCWSYPYTWMFWMKTVICCITWIRISFKYLFYYYLCSEIGSFIISSSPHKFIITNILNSRPTFSFVLQKLQMLLKARNRFWEEGLPYGKQVQEKSKHRIKHMEKCLYGINQVSLMEVIFGLSWLSFMSLTSNCLNLNFYQCWGKRKKSIKMKFQENKQKCLYGEISISLWDNLQIELQKNSKSEYEYAVLYNELTSCELLKMYY